MSNKVYDKVSDDDLRKITGITSDREKAMEARADRSVDPANPSSGLGENILRQEQAAATQGTVASPDSTEPKTKLSPDDINKAENTIGKGYTGSGITPKAPDDSQEDRKTKHKMLAKISQRLKKKGTIFGAIGGTGLIGGVGLLSITVGPMQFMHISKMFLNHDFSSLDDANDHTATQLLRFIFFAKKGQVERTRMNSLGNKYADVAEVRLNSVGLKSAYTQVFGFGDGFVVDRRAPEWRGLDDNQLKKHFKEVYGVDLKPGSVFNASPELNKSGVFVIDMRPGSMSYRAHKKFVKIMLQQAGLNRVTSALGTNLLRTRAAITLHVVKALKNKQLRKLEVAAQDWRKERAKRIEDGTFTPPESKAGSKEDSSPEDKSRASDAAAAGQATAGESAQANADISAGKPGAMKKFQTAVSNKWAVGGIAAATLPCTLRGLDADADNIKYQKVMLPLIRLGTEAIALGEQAFAGIDLTLEQMGFFNSLASGEDANGRKTTWYDARIVKVINGEKGDVGIPPSSTLQTIIAGTPFSFLNANPFDAPLSAVCSPAVQNGIMVISFLGGPIQTALGLLTGPITDAILHEAAKWMAGSAIDINAVGAEWIHNVGYGSRLASNDQSLASGGTVVSKDTERSLDSAASTASAEEFRSKSLAYRLFNPQDYRTPVGRFIDSQSVDSPASNIASLANNFLTVGGQFGNLAFGLLSGHSSAASGDGYYDYGFPRVAVDPAVYMKGKYTNPYQTAEMAADILEGPSGQDYIDKAKRCNGVTIKKDSDGLWTVVSDPNSTPHMKDYTNPECSANGSVTVDNLKSSSTVAHAESKATGWASGFTNFANAFGNSFFGLFSSRSSAQSAPQVQAGATDGSWETITQYINAAVNMNGLGCKFGDDRACDDSGFQTSSSSSSTTPVGIGGDARQIAQLIDTNDNITFQTPADETHFKEIVDTGAQKACAVTIPISPILLSIIQYLSDPARGASAYKIRLGSFAAGHDCDGKQHPKGMAVDINGVGRGSVMSPNNQLHFDALNAEQMNIVKLFYQDFANSFPENVGGMGQYECFPNPRPAKRTGVDYFPDSCDHLHVDARKR